MFGFFAVTLDRKTECNILTPERKTKMDNTTIYLTDDRKELFEKCHQEWVRVHGYAVSRSKLVECSLRFYLTYLESLDDDERRVD